MTNHGPFDMAMGQQTPTPHTRVSSSTRRSLLTYKIAKQWNDQMDEGRLSGGKSKKAPMRIIKACEKDAEWISADKTTWRKHRAPPHEYLVKWKGLPYNKCSSGSIVAIQGEDP